MVGDVNIGAMLRFKGANYRRPLINAYYNFQPLLLPDSWGGGGVDLREAGSVASHGGVFRPQNHPCGNLRIPRIGFRHRLVFHSFQARRCQPALWQTGITTPPKDRRPRTWRPCTSRA